ncbi:MAG: TetR/AcrR family transcriptional regulator [Candidatus Velthaea sp.]|jgi:AcrR family transcriptional regulator
MGIVERKERQKAELRDQILAAARRIVLDEGYAALTMRKIADSIEYSPGTIYLYFQSREEIALQLCREGFGLLLAALAPAAAIEDPVERLRETGRRYVDFAMNEPETYRLIFMGDTSFMKEIFGEEHADAKHASDDDPGTIAYAILENTVAECIATKAFKPMDTRMAAQIIWAGVHGLVALKLSCESMMEGDITEINAAMTETLLHGFMR